MTGNRRQGFSLVISTLKKFYKATNVLSDDVLAIFLFLKKFDCTYNMSANICVDQNSPPKEENVEKENLLESIPSTKIVFTSNEEKVIMNFINSN